MDCLRLNIQTHTFWDLDLEKKWGGGYSPLSPIAAWSMCLIKYLGFHMGTYSGMPALEKGREGKIVERAPKTHNMRLNISKFTVGLLCIQMLLRTCCVNYQNTSKRRFPALKMWHFNVIKYQALKNKTFYEKNNIGEDFVVHPMWRKSV